MTERLMLVDVDDTLYHASSLFSFLAKENGIPWFSQAPFWFRPQDVGIERKALTNMFRKAHCRETVMQQVPFYGAVSTLLNLKAEGWTIWYVSSRHPQAQSVLRDWIQACGFPDYENTVAIMDKITWIDEYQPEVVVDDRVRTMIHARFSLGSEVFAIRQPHNTNLIGEIEGIHICENWTEIGQEIYRYQLSKELARV